MPSNYPQKLGAPKDATIRQLEQRIRFAAAMRPSRHCRPLYIRSAFALLTALQLWTSLHLLSIALEATIATKRDVQSRRWESWQASNIANTRATRAKSHLDVSMMVVTVQSAADPSTLARKAVRAMRHVLVCHGNAAFRTTDFLTSAHARTTAERFASSPVVCRFNEQHYRESTLHVVYAALWWSNQWHSHRRMRLAFQELPRRPWRTHAAGEPLVDPPAPAQRLRA